MVLARLSIPNMRSLVLVAAPAFVTLAAAPALAEPADAPSATAQAPDEPPTAPPSAVTPHDAAPTDGVHAIDTTPLFSSFAIAVNNPIMWSDSTAFGASVYAGITKHHVLRANVASYKFHSNTLGDLIDISQGGDGDEAEYKGRTLDLGVGWMYFPRRAYSGPTYELGALVRSIDTSIADEFAPVYRTATTTTAIAGRALIGWSWDYHGAFFSLACGASAGYEFGTETQQHSDFDPAMMTTHVHRSYVSGEAFARIGYSFDL